ncbi:hypothetical protein PHLGIDRAFT_356665 [Phlebiopsis gigantea 11061_1 CR5-6]|uniref:Uncharacterized protein n=1 Tax=Phlebiopsis gigantea (strain 11061_1 CR5-6) TaxID=745531 RepID=A0A0C3PPG3_PHLG1|nr:hypothetical protein PHLGIDRAFT_356665 [Phlebiopsis gigantea 11061_1 CR5-6]
MVPTPRFVAQTSRRRTSCRRTPRPSFPLPHPAPQAVPQHLPFPFHRRNNHVTNVVRSLSPCVCPGTPSHGRPPTWSGTEGRCTPCAVLPRARGGVCSDKREARGRARTPSWGCDRPAASWQPAAQSAGVRSIFSAQRLLGSAVSRERAVSEALGWLRYIRACAGQLPAVPPPFLYKDSLSLYQRMMSLLAVRRCASPAALRPAASLDNHSGDDNC